MTEQRVGPLVALLSLPGQHGPTEAPLPKPHKFQAQASTFKAQLPRFKAACQQSATSSKQDHLHFRSQLLPISHCIASRCISNTMRVVPRIF